MARLGVLLRLVGASEHIGEDRAVVLCSPYPWEQVELAGIQRFQRLLLACMHTPIEATASQRHERGLPPLLTPTDRMTCRDQQLPIPKVSDRDHTTALADRRQCRQRIAANTRGITTL